MTIEIWKPLMGGSRSVSIALHKIMQEGDVVKLQFNYKRKNGSLLHPYPFLISKEKALTFPKTMITSKKGGGTVACITIPLHEFKEDIPLASQLNTYRKPNELPKVPCLCGSTKFWLTSWGEYVCCACHPSPQIVAEIDIKGIKI